MVVTVLQALSTPLFPFLSADFVSVSLDYFRNLSHFFFLCKGFDARWQLGLQGKNSRFGFFNGVIKKVGKAEGTFTLFIFQGIFLLCSVA